MWDILKKEVALTINQEAKTGIIDLSEDDVTHVEIMINYLYTGELRTKLEESQGISTYERYILSGKTVSHDGFSKLKADRPQDYKHSNYRKLAAQTLVLSANIYILADRLHIEGLKMLASELYEMNSANGWDRAEFTASLKIIFENTQQNDMLLRAVAIKLIKRNLEALMQKKEFDQFCANNSDIGYEILKSDYLRKLQSKPKTCPYAEIDGFHVLRTTPEYQCLGCKKYT